MLHTPHSRQHKGVALVSLCVALLASGSAVRTETKRANEEIDAWRRLSVDSLVPTERSAATKERTR